MRTHSRLLLLLILSLAAVCSPAVQAQALRLMPIGDSITQGSGGCSYRTPLVQSFDSCLVQMVGTQDAPKNPADPASCVSTNFEHQGHGGWKTNDFLASGSGGVSRLRNFVEAAQPGLVIMHIGSNDMNQSGIPGVFDSNTGSATETIGRINTMINQIYLEAPNVTVLLADLIPWYGNATTDSKIDDLRVQINALVQYRSANGDDISLVDVSTGYLPSMMQADGVHPAPSGESFIADRWFQAMQAENFCLGGENPFSIRVEGEDGTLSGNMQVGGDPNASGSAYVSTPGSGSSGAMTDFVELEFNVPETGEYRLLGRLLSPASTANSFFVEVGTSDTWLWHAPVDSNYRNSYVAREANGNNQVAVYLDAGTHTVKVIRREAGTRLDWMELEFLGDNPGGDVDGDGVSNSADSHPNDSTQSGGGTTDGGTTDGGTTDGGTTDGGTTDGGTTDGGTTDGGTTDGQQVEAESGSLVGAMVVGSDPAASGGAYVSVPGTGSSSALNDYVEITLDVPETGTYEIMGRVGGPSSTANSFFVKAGVSDTWVWHFPPTGSDYSIRPVTHNSAVVRVYLQEGQASVRVHRRERSARLDWVNLEFIGTDPSGDVDGDGVANSSDAFPNDSTQSGGGSTDGGTTDGGTTDGGTTDGGTTDGGTTDGGTTDGGTTDGGLRVEGEAGVLVGAMSPGNDSSASGGQYVSVPGTGAGSSLNDYTEMTFDIPETGTYTMLGRVSGPSGSANSFFVKSGTSDTWVWHFPPTGSSYSERPVTHNGSVVQVYLEAGTAKVRVHRRERGARLDWLELSFVGTDASGDVDGDGVVNSEDGFPNDSTQSGGTTTDGGTTDGGTTDGGTTDGGTTDGGTTDGGTTDGGTTDGGLRAEGESGVLVGAMVAASDGAASGGQYVSVPGSGSGSSLNDYVELTFNVPETGTYEMLGRVAGPTSSANSFFVKAGVSDTWVWHFPPTGSAYSERPVTSGGSIVQVYLQSGTAKVRVHRRERSARLDWLELVFTGSDASGDVDGDGVNNSEDGFPNDSTQSGGGTTDGGTTDGGTTDGGTTDGGTTDGGTTGGELRREAENGSLVGAMVTASDPSASGGEYVSVPGVGAGSSLNDYVELTYTIPETGTYEMLGRVAGPSGDANSFFVKSGVSDTWVWHFPPTGANYIDRPVTSGGSTVQVYLEAGQATVRVHRRERSARLDWLELSFVGSDASGDVDGDGIANSADPFPNSSSN